MHFARLLSAIQTAHGQPDKLVMSYHGTPQSYLKKGDPYHCLCHQTTRLVIEKNGFRRRQGYDHIPIPIWPRTMATALH